MTILTVTSAGDVTLDKELLEALDIAPGDRLVVLPRAATCCWRAFVFPGAREECGA